MRIGVNAFDIFRLAVGIGLLVFILVMLKTGDTSIGSNIISEYFQVVSNIVKDILTPIFEKSFT